MLAIRCQFLQGTYAAAAPGRQAEPEWPPHPARLHAALVAAAWAKTDGNTLEPSARSTLDWLELSPPSIAGGREVGFRTSSLSSGSVPTTFVPRNLSPREGKHLARALSKGDDVSRLTGRTARVFPTAVPGDAPIWFMWAEEPPPPVRAGIDQLLTGLQYLGTSRSPVCACIDDHPPPAWLVPAPRRPEAATHSARVAVPGTTAFLITNRFERLRGGFGVPVPYGAPADMDRDHSAVAGPFGRLVILRITAGTRLDAASTWRVTRAFRAAVLSQAGDSAPPVLHGHGPLPHCAFLALPAVGHPEASGRIMGLAVAVPRGLADEGVAAIEGVVQRISTLAIRGLPKAWSLEPLGSAPPLRSVMPTTWTGPSRRWQSVTPVALDRHPKRSRGEGLAALLAESVRTALELGQIGSAPEVSGASVLRRTAVPGAPARGAFRHVPDVGYLCDAQVTFAEPVRGPVLVGRRRHFGIGLFLPVDVGGPE